MVAAPAQDAQRDSEAALKELAAVMLGILCAQLNLRHEQDVQDAMHIAAWIAEQTALSLQDASDMRCAIAIAPWICMATEVPDDWRKAAATVRRLVAVVEALRWHMQHDRPAPLKPPSVIS